MATIAAANPLSCGGGITIETLKHVDLSHLTQHDLKTLSLTSDSFFDVRRQDDVVSPHLLDRSLFNESAGSRRQTYSRRLHHSRRSHTRFPNLKPQLQNQNSNSDAVTHSIVHFIKHFVAGNFNPPPPLKAVPPTFPVQVETARAGFLGFEERKVGKKRKRSANGGKSSMKRKNEDRVELGLKRVNFRGQLIDLGTLHRDGDRVYDEELKKRTVGLENEEGALGFLAGLEGEWCSRRKKRKYVDTGLFGDLFPVGWKVLLGLRRRDYRVSVYCRRFVSPTGQQFLSCKEAAASLKSYFGVNDEDHQKDQKTCCIQQAYISSSEKNSLSADKMDQVVHAIVTHSISTINTSTAQDCLADIENLPEVQVKDIFECFKCNTMFDEKTAYLQHLLSFHEKTTKQKLGTPVGEGVIIRDGKYECQFCHKVFEEKHSYSGHVGVHVRNGGKCSDNMAISVNVHQNVERPMQEVPASRSSKIDHLLEVPQNPDIETKDAGAGEQATTNQSGNMLSLEDTQTNLKNCEAASSSDPRETRTEDPSGKDLLVETRPHDIQAPTGNDTVFSNDCAWNVDIKMDVSCISDLMHSESNEIQKGTSFILDMEYDDKPFEPIEDHLEDTPSLAVEEMLFQDGTQTVQFLPSTVSLSNKGTLESSAVNQKLENATEFGELKLDDIHQYKYGFVDGQDLAYLPRGSLNLGNVNEIENGYSASARFDPEEVIFNALEGGHLTLCVWCRTEFKVEGIELESPLDSIGYMCPTCKAKIPGDFNVF